MPSSHNKEKKSAQKKHKQKTCKTKIPLKTVIDQSNRKCREVGTCTDSGAVAERSQRPKAKIYFY